jgi:hypothetical protein
MQMKSMPVKRFLSYILDNRKAPVRNGTGFAKVNWHPVPRKKLLNAKPNGKEAHETTPSTD